MEEKNDKKPVLRWRPRIRRNKNSTKIRSLRTADHATGTKPFSCCARFLLASFIFLFLIPFVVYNYADRSTFNLLFNLIDEYQAQYQRLRHGSKDYCDKSLYDAENVLRPLGDELLNQHDAQQRFAVLLRKHKDFTPIALIGRSGVGKTFTTKLVTANWQWKDNVHEFLWPTFATNIDRFSTIITAVKKSSPICGHHLMIIDDLAVNDGFLMITINEDLSRIVQMKNLSIVVMYVINLPAYLPKDRQQIDAKMMQLVSEFETKEIAAIPYKILDSDDVRRCVSKECAEKQLQLQPNQIEEIVAGIDAEQSGCKHVANKVALYL